MGIETARFHKAYWAPARTRAGLEDFVWHDLKRCAHGIMELIWQWPLKCIQAELGHAEATTTLKYYGGYEKHRDPNEIANMSAALASVMGTSAQMKCHESVTDESPQSAEVSAFE